MDIAQSLDYVRAAAVAAGIPLEEAAAQRVAEHLMRTSQMVRLLDQADLLPADELVEIFCPAPFPQDGGSGDGA